MHFLLNDLPHGYFISSIWFLNSLSLKFSLKHKVYSTIEQFYKLTTNLFGIDE